MVGVAVVARVLQFEKPRYTTGGGGFVGEGRRRNMRKNEFVSSRFVESREVENIGIKMGSHEQ